jgi:all-trans-retinol 13,14-reductase
VSFDFVIIGSGMGGLVCAHILCDHGFKVCVLEKNQQLGGSLQVFSRGRTLFDTGVHYIGGLEAGQPLHRVFDYLGLMDGVKWQRMDARHDRFTVADDPTVYYHAQGVHAFADGLKQQFPNEHAAIDAYMEAVGRMLRNFPLDSLELADRDHLDDELLAVNARDFIASLTQDEKLQAVLGGANLLHAGTDRLPFHVHALVTGSYMRSAHKCIDGGSQIAKVLARRIRERGGTVLARKEVVRFEMDGDTLVAAVTADGDRIEGRRFISNIHPLATYDMVGREQVKPSTYNRLARMPHTLSSFNVHIVCRPESFPYLNHNHYHHSTYQVWARPDDPEIAWPQTYMLSTPATSRSPKWAEGISIMTYMRSDTMDRWAQTHNTIVRPGQRGEDYEAFNAEMAERLLNEVEKRYPDIRNCISEVHTTTPLTFRDFLGTHGGALYGYEKDHRFPFRGFISPATRIPNLYLTGQHIHLHGIQGVTISALVTCSEFIDRKEILRRIKGE